jgi:inorganic pyrophosphatase
MAMIASITMRAAPLAAKRAVGSKAPAMRAVARRATLRTSAPCRMAYTSEPKGDFPSMDYRIFFKEDGKTLSPWHDIPLRNADGTFNAIIEIPKETMAKVPPPPPSTHMRTRSDTCGGPAHCVAGSAAAHHGPGTIGAPKALPGRYACLPSLPTLH